VSQILVVQSNRGLAENLGHVLASRGHNVVLAASCQEADALHQHFDIGIFDVRLPDGSGTHLAARLSGFGRVRCRIFYTGERPSPIARPPDALGPVIRHGTPIEKLLAAIDEAIGALEQDSVHPRSTVRPASPVRGKKPGAAGSGSGGS
jgi:DNA-binding NtrC family response regulator